MRRTADGRLVPGLPPAWKDIEAILSDRPAQVVAPPVVVEHTGQVTDDAYRPARTVDYAELHAHSHFSFLDGALSPEDMAAQAARLGLGRSPWSTTTVCPARSASRRPRGRRGSPPCSGPS